MPQCVGKVKIIYERVFHLQLFLKMQIKCQCTVINLKFSVQKIHEDYNR